MFIYSVTSDIKYLKLCSNVSLRPKDFQTQKTTVVVLIVQIFIVYCNYFLHTHINAERIKLVADGSSGKLKYEFYNRTILVLSVKFLELYALCNSTSKMCSGSLLFGSFTNL